MYGTASRQSISSSSTISGVLLLVLASVFALSSMEGAPPDRSELVSFKGAVERITPATFGKQLGPTRFRLDSDAREFQYISKSGEIGRVEAELIALKGSPVHVLVDPDDRFSTVLEIEINGHTVRTYDAITTAWRHDNRLGIWIASTSGLVGLGVLARARWRA